MKITNFLASLLPTFGKETVLEDCRLTRTEIKEFTAPAYDTALNLLKGWKFKAPELQIHIGIFSRTVKGSGNDNMVVTIQKSWKPILENLDSMEDLVTRTYNNEMAGAGFTYLKANILQFVECVSFVSKYARKYLSYIYICETAQYPDSGTALTESLTPAEVEWLNANFVSFCTALNIAAGNHVQVKKQLEDIPDIVVTEENSKTLPSTVGDHKLDPFQMKLIPIWMNPVYHVGMAIAEWQAKRYKAAKEEHTLLQLRKLNLEKQRDGKRDAHLEKEITYIESRAQALNYKLAEMERNNE
jgi:hypothetical protein